MQKTALCKTISNIRGALVQCKSWFLTVQKLTVQWKSWFLTAKPCKTFELQREATGLARLADCGDIEQNKTMAKQNKTMAKQWKTMAKQNKTMENNG